MKMREVTKSLGGQLSVLALVMVFLVIILATNFVTPIINVVNSSKSTNQFTPLTGIMLDLLAPLLVILAIVAMFQYATPSRETK